MASRIEIYEKISGKLLQHEEWWFLVPGKDGTRHVMLERYSIDPGRKAPAKVVRRKIPVEKVLARGDDVAEALQSVLQYQPGARPLSRK